VQSGKRVAWFLPNSAKLSAHSRVSGNSVKRFN
jgi:hypothetical protein